MLLASGGGMAESRQGVVEETGLRYWEWEGAGVLFRLTQRLPDQTRAFFLARGFSAGNADFIATRCVFQSMFQNIGGTETEIAIDLTDWTVRVGPARTPLLTREAWRAAPQLQQASDSAMIALEWSLLPTSQIYQRDDYNWGMTSYGLPPGSVFDLEFSWRSAGERHLQVLRNVECPPDIHPQPEQPP